MPRHCGLCDHPKRKELEQRVLEGTTFREIARESGLSEAACTRHWRIHAKPELRRSLPAAHLSDFAVRLWSLANDAAEQRQHSREREDTKLVLSAMREERAALGDLMGVLGVSDEETVAQLQEARALVLAVRDVVINDHPELAEHLAQELDRQHQPDLADSLRGLAADLGPPRLQALPTPDPKEHP
jgi:transposase-like protein